MSAEPVTEPDIASAALDDPRYSPLVRQLFDRRPHAGRMEAAPDVVEGHAGGALDGAEVRFWLKVTGDRIQATSFLAYGCPHVVATAAWMAQRARGMQLAEIARADWRQAEQILAIPPEKRGRLLIVEDALQAAANALR
jgi:NifU-like protein involved in Fe-S cluster formation